MSAIPSFLSAIREKRKFFTKLGKSNSRWASSMAIITLSFVSLCIFSMAARKSV